MEVCTLLYLMNGLGAEVIQCCFWLETYKWGELGNRVYCHCEESNYLCTIDLIVFAKRYPSYASKHCSRILNWQSSPGGWIFDAQYHRCKKKTIDWLKKIDWAATLSYVLQLWRWRALPLCRLLLCVRVVSIDPTLIGDDPWHERWMTMIFIDFNTMFFMLSCQQAGEKLDSDSAYSIQTLGLPAWSYMTDQQHQ